jgi:hypothetical protein
MPLSLGAPTTPTTLGRRNARGRDSLLRFDCRLHDNFFHRFSLNQGLAQPNHKDIPLDQRTIEDGIPNHQFVEHHDFDGVRRSFIRACRQEPSTL